MRCAEAFKSLKVVNDAAERALGLVTEFHNNRVTCNPEQQQHIYRIVRDIRQKQGEMVSKRGKERLTKKTVRDIKYNEIYDL